MTGCSDFTTNILIKYINIGKLLSAGGMQSLLQFKSVPIIILEAKSNLLIYL